jgi:peptide/nickel transport system ATP-binding protein
MKQNDLILDVRDLRIEFNLRQGVLTAVNDISFKLRKGKVLGMVGESGSGKSVAVKSLLRIESPARIVSGEILFRSENHGQISLQDVDPKSDLMRSVRWKEISMIFQEPMSSFGPMHTFGNQIAEAVLIHMQVSKNEAREMTIESLRAVGMPRPEKVAGQYPHQVSGGMRQRAMIAMALICNPEILIADEPTTALDVSTEAQILDVLSERQKMLNTSIIYISHNLGVVSNIADDVIVMYLGRIVEYAPVRQLFNKPLHPYTLALLNSIPRIDADYSSRKLEVLGGNIPDPYNLPSGCSFHPRCSSFIKGLCDVVVPELQPAGNEQGVACHLYNPVKEHVL